MTETLGDRLAQARRDKAQRERRDVSKIEIAKAAGVDSSMVSQYESGAKVPREGTLAKLAAFLGVTPAYLRYGVLETKRAPLEESAIERALNNPVPVSQTKEQDEATVAQRAAKSASAKKANGGKRRA